MIKVADEKVDDGTLIKKCNRSRTRFTIVADVKLPVGGGVCHVRREVHSTRVNLKKLHNY
jgi:hypothetical protein